MVVLLHTSHFTVWNFALGAMRTFDAHTIGGDEQWFDESSFQIFVMLDPNNTFSTGNFI